MTRKTRSTGPRTNHTENGKADDSFRWIGSGVKVNRVMHFGKCEVDGMEVCVGGNVEIKLEDNSAVAEIRELYETVGDSPHRARIRWYYPLKDIPRKYQLLVEKPNDKELFKPEDGLFLGSEEDIDVETIMNTVTVWEIGEDDTPPPGDYFVRYCFPAISTSRYRQKLIPIIGGIETEHQLDDDEDEDSESTEDEEVIINYTKIKGKAEDAENADGDMKSPQQSETSDIANNDGLLSGKLKKNAQKWKSYSTDEVLAELWKTDKDTGGTGKKSNLKRKLGSPQTKTNSISSNNNSINKDNETTDVAEKMEVDIIVSTVDSKEKESDVGSTDTVTREDDAQVPNDKQDVHSESKPTDGESESSIKLTVNKNMSPFKAIPKKKETSSVSVFDFDDMGGSKPLKVNRSGKKDNDNGVVSKSHKKKKGVISVNTQKKTTVKTPKALSDSAKKRKGEVTPGISQRKTPRADAKNMLELARKRLHVSAVPETLPCRDDQFSQIFSFVQDRLKEETGGCMYISGVPGTGKTATVREVIRTLKENIEESIIPDFKFIEINGMKLTDPNHAYTEILKALESKKATPDHASDLLSQRFRSGNNENVVLLVDELDLLCTRKQNVMYNIFDWPTHKRSRLVVLAVANTMDLPERMMMNRVSSRLGLTRMTFQPYTFKELEEIVMSRVRGTDAFEDDALQLVARKVAAVSGDARRCLDICRRAVEISENAESKKPGSGPGVVGMKHVDLALKEMFSSPKIVALQCLSEMETMFMKAVISEFRRTGLEEAIFLEVYDQFKNHCTLEDGIQPPNMSQAFTICNNLGTCRLLLVEAGQKDVHQRIRLNVNIDDAMFAFKSRGS